MTSSTSNQLKVMSQLTPRTIGFGLLVIVIILAAYVFLGNLSEFVPPPLGGAAETVVSIYGGSNGGDVSADESMLIMVEAFSETPFQALQLYVDGELMGVSAASEGGSMSMATPFFWRPGEAGLFSLHAEAVLGEGESAFSDLLQVLVSERVYEAVEGEGADGSSGPSMYPGVPVSGGFTGGGGLTPPDSSENVAPAEEIPSAAAPNSNPATVAPVAPELAGKVQECSVQLSVHDLSSNESGFILFRHSSSSPGWQQIAMLNAQSDADWIQYTDSNVQPGHVSYRVSAFNDAGSATSNLANFAMGSANCAPIDLAETPAFDLIQLVSLVPEQAVDMGYCYKSLAGGPFSRFPANGFLTPDENNDLLSGQAATIFKQAAEIGQGAFPGLSMACWGWMGNDLAYLGDFGIDPIESVDQESIMPGDVSFGLSPSLVYDPNTTEINESFEPYLWYPFDAPDYNMPVFQMEFSGSASECAEYLDSSMSDSLSAAWCAPYSQYGEDDPQKYVFWYEIGNCTGTASECMTYADWLAKSEQEGGEVGFFVTETTQNFKTLTTITQTWQHVMHIVPGDCSNQRAFSVRMYYQPPNGQIIYSHPSAPPIKTGICIEDAPLAPVDADQKDYVILEISFDSLVLQGVDDDDFGTETVEIYGGFYVFKKGTDPYAAWNAVPPAELAVLRSFYGPGVMGTSYLNLATYNHQDSACPDDVDPDLSQLYPSGNISLFCPQRLPDGAWDLAQQIYMCESNTHDQCAIWGGNEPLTITSPTYGNNSLYVLVKDGDELQISMSISDWDDGSGSDTICRAGSFLGPRSLDGWRSYDLVPFTIISPDYNYHGAEDQDAEQCVLNGTITAVGP